MKIIIIVSHMRELPCRIEIVTQGGAIQAHWQGYLFAQKIGIEFYQLTRWNMLYQGMQKGAFIKAWSF